MTDLSKPFVDTGAVRVDYVPAADYISPEMGRLESERLWRRVWQIACREEELPHPGSYVTYGIVDQSVIVLRTGAGDLRAYHNACLHRGRELTTGCGTMTKVHCPFHGWQWDLEGQITRVPDRGDWDGYPNMDDGSLRLKEVKLGTWGGWVFINLDPHCEPFEAFIDPLPKYLDCLEFDKMRFAWRKRFTMQANWKVAIEAFLESYHVATTHPQAVPVVDPANFSSAHGKHGRHAYYWENPLGSPSPASGLPPPADLREAAARMTKWTIDELSDVNGTGNQDSQMSARSAYALQRHLTETPPTASAMEIAMLSQQYMAEAAIAEGAGWPVLTPAQFAEIGADWNIFPNVALVHSLDATLVMWAKPNGKDSESCQFEMAAIARYAPGKEPKPAIDHLKDWHAEIDRIPHLLSQDLSNIEAVHRGLHSISLQGTRINPKQETQISHFHEVLHNYLAD